MTADRLRRLVRAAFVRGNEGALIDLRMWAEAHPDDARAAAEKDVRLKALLADRLGHVAVTSP